MANIVAIVGRPNVGKSTLFNRLVERRDAIVDDVSGVTRDRHYGQAEWVGRHFTVIDTGGYVVGSEDVFEAAIREQIEIALEEATVILFLVDAVTGLTGDDQSFANLLRRSAKKVILVCNKADNVERAHMSMEFYALALGEVFPVSAMSGSGTGELLDEVIQHFSPEVPQEATDIPRIAVVGRPNVGKSSFINTLLQKNRSIVTDMAGTTRDAVDAVYNAYGKTFILTDTAGIRRKSKIRENIEFYSILRSLKAIEDCDVCIVMIDATLGLEAQDLNIIYQAQKFRKGIVLMVNKWDLLQKDSNTAHRYEESLKERLAPHTYIPVLFTSVLEKQRIFKAIETAMVVYEHKNQKIPTSALNETMLQEIERYPPPTQKGRYVKIKYITQLPTPYPSFVFFCNHPQYVREAYQRFLENRLRQHFNFEGVPMRLFFRKK